MQVMFSSPTMASDLECLVNGKAQKVTDIPYGAFCQWDSYSSPSTGGMNTVSISPKNGNVSFDYLTVYTAIAGANAGVDVMYTDGTENMLSNPYIQSVNSKIDFPFNGSSNNYD